MTRRHTFLGTAALAVCVGLSAPAQDVVAIKAGRVITMAGPDLENAVILVESGRIKAIGSDVEAPWNAKVIDATKHVVAPTWILAHTSGGMSSNNERMANVPFLTVQDAVDPSSRFFEEALRNGVGTMHVIPGNSTLIGGRGMILRPDGKTVEDMTVRTQGGIKLSLLASGGSRMAQIRKLRRALVDAKDYKAEYDRRKSEFEQEKAAGATEKKEFEEELDRTKKPILDMLDGKLLPFLYVPSAAEISEVEYLVREHGIKPVLVLGSRCHQAAERIAALDLPIVLDSGSLENYERDPETEDEELVNQAGLLAKANVRYALSVSSGTSGAQRYPWWQMATAIRGGVDRQVAMQALTTVPAEFLGLADEIGTLEVGKIANVQVVTGDPLQATSWVDTVLLEGRVVYERSKDRRLEHLFDKSEEKQ